MPYDLQTQSGLMLRNIPDDWSPEDPRLKAMAQQHDAQQPRAKPQAPRDALTEFDPTEGMSSFEKVAANVGAGADDVIQGAKQRFYEWSNQDRKAKEVQGEIAEKRKRDEHLAGKTTGGKALQVVGSALPLTLAAFVPGAQGAVGGALTGAAGGYLQPTTEDESVLTNTAIGGALGAVLPLAVRGAKGLYGRFGPGSAQRRAAAQVGEQLGQEGAPITREAVEALLPQLDNAAGAQAPAAATAAAGQAASPSVGSVLGAGGRQSAAGLQGAQGAAGGIPLSTAARLQNAELARLEQASRLRNPDMWLDFDRTQGRAISDSVRSATEEAGELAGRRATRGAAYREASEEFDRAVNPETFSQEVQRLRSLVDAELAGPEAVNRTVRTALEELQGQLSNETITPAHVRALRRELSAKISPADPLRAAPRDNPAIISLTRQLDDALDASGGGRFRPINEAYGEASRGVDASRAAQQVRDTFYDPITGLSRKTSLDAAGEIPVITEAGINQAFRATDLPGGASRLSPQAREVLGNTLASIRAQNQIQQMNRAATSGGGSATAPNLTALAQEEARRMAVNSVANSSIPGRVVVESARAVDSMLNSRRDALVAQALRDPAQMASLLRTLEQASPEVAASMWQQLRAASAALGGKGVIAGAADAATPQHQR